MREYIDKAVLELKQKSLNDIQQETAKVWAGRACAAAQAGNAADALEYSHEAIEHAALSGNDKLLAQVRALMRHFGVPV